MATGLALLAVLTEPTIKVLLSKTEQVAVNLPGVRPVPAPPFRPDRLAVGSLVVVAVGGVLAAAGGAPAVALPRRWCCWVSRPSLIMIGYAAAGQPDQQGVAGRACPRRWPGTEPAFAVYYGGEHGARYQLGHVAALPGTARPAVRGDHPRGRDGADDHRAHRGAGGGAADHQRAGRPGHAGGDVDEGRLLRPGQSGQPELPALPPADPRLAQPRRLRQGCELQRPARDVRQGARLRPAGRGALRRPRRDDPARSAAGRRPTADREDRGP